MNDTIRSDNQARLNTLRSEVAHREHAAEILSTADGLKTLPVSEARLHLQAQATFDLSALSVDRKLALFAFAAQLLEAQAADVLKE